MFANMYYFLFEFLKLEPVWLSGGVLLKAVSISKVYISGTASTNNMGVLILSLWEIQSVGLWTVRGKQLVRPNFMKPVSSQICLAWNFFLDYQPNFHLLHISWYWYSFAYPENHVQIWLVILFF